MIKITTYNIHDDVTILGHVFHGLNDIMQHVEMSLYRDWSRGKAHSQAPDVFDVGVHVGEMWMPYPTFDFEDMMNENRSYYNFIIRPRPITQQDMKKLSDLPSKSNEQRITEDVPADMLPLVYYDGDSDEMLVATEEGRAKVVSMKDFI